MQVQKLLKRKKGVCSDVFQDGNELFLKKITSPLKEAHKMQLLLQINLKTNNMMRRTAAQECPSCSFDSLSWRINSDHIFLLS